MKIDDLTLLAASRQSWDAVVAQGDALKHYDYVQTESPEILDAHTKVVKATFEADFDPVKAERIVSGGRRDFKRHLFEDTQAFRVNLAKFLRTKFGA